MATLGVQRLDGSIFCLHGDAMPWRAWRATVRFWKEVLRLRKTRMGAGGKRAWQRLQEEIDELWAGL